MKQQQVHSKSTILGRMVLMCLAMAMLMPAMAQAARPKVMIVPFYSEAGRKFNEIDADRQDFYRDVVNFVGAQLSRDCFVVANQWANDAMIDRSDWINSRPREFSAHAIGQLCNRYGLSAVYVVRVKIFPRNSSDGYTVLKGVVRSDGYNAAGNSLGIPLKEKFSVSARSFDEAMIDLGTELGDIVGAELAGSANGGCGAFYTAVTGDRGRRPGHGSDRPSMQTNAVTVKLTGMRNSEVVEAFGKILQTSAGVQKHGRDRLQKGSSEVHRDNVAMSHSNWQIELDKRMSQEVLQANIIKNAKDIVKAGGKAFKKGVPYRYDYKTIRELAGLTVGDNYAEGNLTFKIDRNKMRSWERSHRR